MKFHIVQVNERVQDISKKYNVSLEEIIKLNRHINNIDSIVPGMKIRLPILSDEVSDELKDNFLDIEKYYPKVEDFKEVYVEKKNDYDQENPAYHDEAIPIENETAVKNIEIQQQPTYTQPAYPYQPYPQAYQAYPQQQMYQPPQYQTQYQLQQQYNPYYQAPVYNKELNQPQQQNNPYYQTPIYNRDLNQPQLKVKKADPKVENQADLTIPYLKERCPNIDQKLFEQPALCNPVGLNQQNKTRNEDSLLFYQSHTNMFQSPLFNPPYPCGKPIEEIDNNKIRNFKGPNKRERIEDGFDEEVKEIKLDLRDYIKKHTKVTKKKDPLDLL